MSEEQKPKTTRNREEIEEEDLEREYNALWKNWAYTGNWELPIVQDHDELPSYLKKEGWV